MCSEVLSSDIDLLVGTPDSRIRVRQQFYEHGSNYIISLSFLVCSSSNPSSIEQTQQRATISCPSWPRPSPPSAACLVPRLCPSPRSDPSIVPPTGRPRPVPSPTPRPPACCRSSSPQEEFLTHPSKRGVVRAAQEAVVPDSSRPNRRRCWPASGNSPRCRRKEPKISGTRWRN